MLSILLHTYLNTEMTGSYCLFATFSQKLLKLLISVIQIFCCLIVQSCSRVRFLNHCHCLQVDRPPLEKRSADSLPVQVISGFTLKAMMYMLEAHIRSASWGVCLTCCDAKGLSPLYRYLTNKLSSRSRLCWYSSLFKTVKTVTMFLSRRSSSVGSQNSYTPSAWRPGWMPMTRSGSSTRFRLTYLTMTCLKPEVTVIDLTYLSQKS